MRKAKFALAFMGMLFTVQLCFAESKNTAEQAVVKDIVAILLGSSQNSQVEEAVDGFYLESNFCAKDTSLSDLLKNKTKIQDEQALIDLFSRMLCAPRNDDVEVELKPFIAHLHDPIPVDIVMYSGMVKLGKWSFDDAIPLSEMSANEATISMLGLNPDSSIPTVLFWQIISPEYVRIWYGRFKMAPSDAIIYDFKFEHEKWMLTKLWLASRI